MMLAPSSNVQDLGRTYPEWKPWLAVIEQVLHETGNSKWDTFVPASIEAQPGKVPMLAGAKVVVELYEITGWTQRLIRIAAQSGAPKMASMKRIAGARLNKTTLFKSSLCYNAEEIIHLATTLEVDADALQALAVLIAVPFLHACNRRLAPTQPAGWTEGYCPICGGWPAFAEVRGIERSRYSRCGRCGGEWQVHCLSCPYCGTTDHNQMISLRPEGASSMRVIDACKRCLGYVKTFTTLQATPAARIILDDLASVEFDVAALEQGYQRPHDTGYSFDVELLEQEPSNTRFFRWRT